jgi:ATP-dependent RNA helicase RhlE
MVRAERVKKAMERVGIVSLCIHRDVDQNEREASLDLFKQGVVTVLISTDLSARGIDVDNVRYVVNYDLPEQPENYVHRVGRTGRMRKKGEAVSFCSPDERPLLKEIEEYTDEKIEVLEIDGGDYQETILFSEQHDTDWRKLMELAQELDDKSKKKKVKKKKKK